MPDGEITYRYYRSSWAIRIVNKHNFDSVYLSFINSK